MNVWFIVATFAFFLLVPQFNCANAAGPYDGACKGAATPISGRCKRASVDLTVEGQAVLGQAKIGDDTSNINGTVNDTGAMGATIGFQLLRGQFNGDEFRGTFQISDCQWEALLRRTTTGNRNVEERNQTASDGLKGR